MDFTRFLDPLKELSDCSLCSRECHADRFGRELGYCKSDASFNISSICIHKGEEPVISGPRGICNAFFAHCNLQCIYCQNWQISINRTEISEFGMEISEVISQITSILDTGINMVGFVSPSHHIPQMKVIINIIHSLGYKPVWVFNTNGYDKPGIIRSLEGIIDVFLPDFKYMDKNLSEAYSDAPDYPEVAEEALKEMYRQKGSALHINRESTAESGIIIRHLVLPGQVMNSVRVLRCIAEKLSPEVHISLMSQYYPTPLVSCHPYLSRPVSTAEYSKVTKEMDRLGMHNGWIQSLESSGTYCPDFNKFHPFK